MNQPLPAYPDYKPAGLPWLKQVPAHWEIKRNKYLFRERDARSQTGAEELLTVSQYTGITKRADRRKHAEELLTTAASLVGYKLVDQNDLVINIMLAWNGSLGISDFNGIVSPAYCVYKPTSTDYPRYFHYLFRTPLYKAMYKAVSTGVVDSRLRLYSDKFFALQALLPPLPEQQRVVAFLDGKTRQIARLLRHKRQLIKLLQEQKQALIHRAVTQGLDAAAPRKNSGVAWLGEVPAHWEVKRLKDEFHCLNRTRIPLSSPERGQMTVRIYDYYGASGVIDKVDDYLFDDELLLIAEDGANLVLRNLPLAIIARGKFWVNNHAHILKPKNGSLEYFAHLLECINYTPWITGAAQPKLTKDRLMAIQIPVPTPEEQCRIVEFIKADTQLLDQTVEQAKREIELIQEYRTRLIADVVTGQVDVRHLAVAAAAPDELAELMAEEVELGEEELVEETLETDG